MTDPRRVATADEPPTLVPGAASGTVIGATDSEPADDHTTEAAPQNPTEAADDTSGDSDDENVPGDDEHSTDDEPPTSPSGDEGDDGAEDAPADDEATSHTAVEVAGEPGATARGGWWGPVKAQLAELGAKAAALNEPAVEQDADSADEFNLWSELGVYEPSPEESAAGDYDPRRRQALHWLIGGVGFVVIVSILFTLGMFSSERKLYRSVTSPTPTSIATPQSDGTPEPSEEPTDQQTEEPSEKPSPTPTPTALKTPTKMVEGTKQCAEGLWSGPQTSCNLAQATADQVDRAITTPVEIQAFSSTTNRNYRLQCTPGEGITCVGLDGVNGVVIYIAAP